MLTDELSAAAAGLYEKLLAVGPGRLSAGDEDPEVVTELVDAGFVLRHGSGRLDAVEPAYVAEHLLARINDRMSDQHRRALRLRQELNRLTSAGGTVATDARIEVLTDPVDIRRMSADIFLGARHEILMFNTEHFADGPGPARGLPPE